MLIESTNNEKIKNLSRLLTDNRFRKNSGIFAVEGKQENQRAINFGQEAEEFFICESIFDEDFPRKRIFRNSLPIDNHVKCHARKCGN